MAWSEPEGRLAWAPLVVVSAIIIIASHQSSPRPPLGMNDKVLHVLAYGAHGLAAEFAFTRGLSSPRRGQGFLLSVLFGASDEYHQSFIDGRLVEWLDWVADVIGACIGALLLRAWDRRPL